MGDGSAALADMQAPVSDGELRLEDLREAPRSPHDDGTGPTLHALVARHTAGERPALSGASSLLRALRRRRGSPQCVWLAGPGGPNELLTVGLLGAALGAPLDILASDLSLDVVERLQVSVVSGADLHHVPRALCPRGAIIANTHGHHLDFDALGHRVRAVVGDLNEGAPAGQFDVVVCRRVLHHYRPARARMLLKVLLGAVAPEGCLVLDAVDALALGLPLPADDAIALDARGDRPALPANDDDDVCLVLAELFDPESRVKESHRRRRLALFDDAEARLALAVTYIKTDQDDEARLLLGAVDDDDSDAQITLALLDLRAGRPAVARARLEGRVGSSWLGTALLARAFHALHLDSEAQRRHRQALALLDGPGDAPAPLSLLSACEPDIVRRVGREALRGNALVWHGL